MTITKWTPFCIPIALALLAAGCKKDDKPEEDPGPLPVENGMAPQEGKKFLYDIIAEDEGITAYSYLECSTTAISDSAGLKVYKVRSINWDNVSLRDTTVATTFVKGQFRMNIPGVPVNMLRSLRLVRKDANYYDIELKGSAMSMKFPYQPAQGAQLAFVDGPVSLTYKKRQAADIIDLGYALTYSEGVYLGRENVVTTAGTYDCEKWSYGYKASLWMHSQLHPDTNISSQNQWSSTLWLCHGVGMVKLSEKTGNYTITTQLTKVE